MLEAVLTGLIQLSPVCPPTEVYNTPLTSYVIVESHVAERGCIRLYGKNECLHRFVKTGERSFQAWCWKNPRVFK